MGFGESMSSKLIIESRQVIDSLKENISLIFEKQEESLIKTNEKNEVLNNIHNMSIQQVDYMEKIKSESSDFQKYITKQQLKHRKEETDTEIEYNKLFSKCEEECKQTSVNEKESSKILTDIKEKRDLLLNSILEINNERTRGLENITNKYSNVFETWNRSIESVKNLIDKYKSELKNER